MVQLKEKGISDIIVIVFMVILMVLSATFLYGFTGSSIDAAVERQKELKVQHLHRSLERVTVEPYGVSALKAGAEQVIFKNPTVPENYLRCWIENTLGFYLPTNAEAKLSLSYSKDNWSVSTLDNFETLGKGDNFVQRGSVTLTASGGGFIRVKVLLSMFEVEK